jgi:hypothetical protein
VILAAGTRRRPDTGGRGIRQPISPVPGGAESVVESPWIAPDQRGILTPHRAYPRTALPYQVIYAIARHTHTSLGIVRVRERRGSQGCSCTPGRPGPATGRHQLLASGDQLPDSPGRFRCGPPAQRGRRRDRAAGIWPWPGGRPPHGPRRGTQRSGRHGRNLRRHAGGFAAAARDRGPFSIPDNASPARVIPGCEPHCVLDGSLPVCGQFPATLPARALGASPLLNLELCVLQDRLESRVNTAATRTSPGPLIKSLQTVGLSPSPSSSRPLRPQPTSARVAGGYPRGGRGDPVI